MDEAYSEFKFQGLKPVKTTHSDSTRDEPLSPMACLFHKPENSLHIISLLGSKSRMDPDHFKAGIASAFLAHPRFTSFPVSDKSENEKASAKMRWVQTKVDIDQHVFFLNVESKDTAQVGLDKYVEDYTRDLTSLPLDMSKPLWDVHVLNLNEMTSQGAMAVALFRCHHSIGDGASLMSLFMSLTSKASNKTTRPSLPTFTDKGKKDRSKKGDIWSFIRLLWNTIMDILNALATAFFLDDTPNPLKAHKDATSHTPRRIILKSVSLEDIKTVKNITNTTVNDVVMGIIESGLSLYLNRKYVDYSGLTSEEKDKMKKHKGSNLPQNLRFRGVSFFNIRALSGIQAVEDMMSKNSKTRWGNQIGYVIYPFKLLLRENSPLDYIYRAHSVMSRKKESLESHFAYHFGKLLLKTFGFKLASLPARPTLWLSNMIGPQEDICIFGYPVAYLGSTCYGQPTALMIHVMSYANKLSFILSSDDNILPNPHELCEDFEHSLEAIKMAAIAKLKNEKMQE